jgi:hypothetical protein
LPEDSKCELTLFFDGHCSPSRWWTTWQLCVCVCVLPHASAGLNSGYLDPAFANGVNVLSPVPLCLGTYIGYIMLGSASFICEWLQLSRTLAPT